MESVAEGTPVSLVSPSSQPARELGTHHKANPGSTLSSGEAEGVDKPGIQGISQMSGPSTSATLGPWKEWSIPGHPLN